MNLCRHLSYVRSISPGKAVFYYITPNDPFVPLGIESTKINGMKSGFLEAYDSKLNPKNIDSKDLSFGNPHTIEACYVPPNIKELCCRFSVRVEANSLEPNICDDKKVHQWLCRFADSYKAHGGYFELARRYCMNLLMGNWLWRNQQTLGTKIEILTSNNTKYKIEDARRLGWEGRWSAEDQKTLFDLAREMSNALSDPSVFWFADVTAHLSTSFCQEIHPSQKFVDKNDNTGITRQLSLVNCDDGRTAACFHAEKIGAALHMIDDWWSDYPGKRLRVHEYGADKKLLIGHRHPVTKKDFYTLLKRVILYVRQLRLCVEKNGADIEPDIHFVMSVLIKGGMFQRGKG